MAWGKCHTVILSWVMAWRNSSSLSGVVYLGKFPTVCLIWVMDWGKFCHIVPHLSHGIGKVPQCVPQLSHGLGKDSHSEPQWSWLGEWFPQWSSVESLLDESFLQSASVESWLGKFPSVESYFMESCSQCASIELWLWERFPGGTLVEPSHGKSFPQSASVESWLGESFPQSASAEWLLESFWQWSLAESWLWESLPQDTSECLSWIMACGKLPSVESWFRESCLDAYGWIPCGILRNTSIHFGSSVKKEIITNV